MHWSRSGWCATVLTVIVLAAAACGDDGGGGGTTTGGGLNPPNLPALTELGPGEGEVNLIAWAGYVEDGTNDPAVDWVTGFE